jgi:hypothetical protein
MGSAIISDRSQIGSRGSVVERAEVPGSNEEKMSVNIKT